MPIRSLFPLLLLPLFVQGQPFRFEVDYSVRVSLDGQDLPNAWAGGLNAGQFSTLHLDADSIPDLVVFDRTDGKLTAFVAKLAGGRYAYRHAPEYEPLFPDLRFWLLLADYDHDGRKDAFTHTNLGVKVYRNVTQKAGELKWAVAREALYTRGYRDSVNLRVGAGDIPAIADVDNDGDLDILAYDQAGSYVEYHQNQSVERYGHARALEFRRVNACWGNFEEGAECGDFDFSVDCEATGRQMNIEGPTRNVESHRGRGAIRLGGTPPAGFFSSTGSPITGPPSGAAFAAGPPMQFFSSTVPTSLPDDRFRIQHAGSTLLALDLDGDRDQDLLVGDVSCPTIFRMT
ncbi:MAG: VCBS repeat-containing protein, partial [Ferruginibacter sp.]|nr:VCBS repeat-containing protein [Cytophagales bacterium]